MTVPRRTGHRPVLPSGGAARPRRRGAHHRPGELSHPGAPPNSRRTGEPVSHFFGRRGRETGGAATAAAGDMQSYAPASRRPDRVEAARRSRVKIDTHVGDLPGLAERAVKLEPGGLRRGHQRRDPARPLPAPDPRRRAHQQGWSHHRHRRRLRPQPDDPRPAGHDLQEFSGGRFILGLARRSARREALLDDVVAPGAADARADQRRPGDQELVDNGSKLDFRGDFYTRTLCAVLHPRPVANVPHASSSPPSARR